MSGMSTYVVNSVYKSGYTRIVKPARAQNRIPPNSHISLEQSYIFRKLHHQKGLSYLIGEAKCLSPNSNLSFAYLKFFNRTLKGK